MRSVRLRHVSCCDPEGRVLAFSRDILHEPWALRLQAGHRSEAVSAALNEAE